MNLQQNNQRYCCDGTILPSVSTILKSDPKHKTFKKSLGAAGAEQSRRSLFAKERGLEVHAAARRFIRTGEVDLAEKYFPYWTNIQKSLSLLEPGKIWWADGPADDSLQHLQQGEHSAVWDKQHKYVGCPDLVADCGGVRILAEVKTSDTLFDSTYKMDFKSYGSFFRFHQASMQVACYISAFEKTTGITIDAGVIVVGTRDESQLFILEKPELQKALKKFLKLAKDFHATDTFVQPTNERKELVSV